MLLEIEENRFSLERERESDSALHRKENTVYQQLFPSPKDEVAGA